MRMRLYIIQDLSVLTGRRMQTPHPSQVGGNLYFPKSGMEDKSPIQVHKFCDISVSVCEAVL